VVTHQLQVERRTAKGHRPKTDALPLDHTTTLSADASSDQPCCKRYICLSTRQRCISSCKDTIKQLQQETPDFTGPDLWPPKSPDLNLMDYKVRGVMQQIVYECHMNSVDELKLRLIEVWNSLQQNVIERPSTTGESN